MKIPIFLSLIVSSISSAEHLRPVYEKGEENRLLKGITVYTDRSAWLNALAAYDVATEDFSDVLPQSASSFTLGVGANDVGLFDIVVSSVAEPSTLSVGDDGIATFDASYKKGEIEITINNFDGGIAYGFGGNWEVVDEAGINTDDFRILVDGTPVDIGSFPNGRTQYGIGFVGVVDVANGFNEITYTTTGSAETQVSLGQISVTDLSTNSPSLSSSPSTGPSVSFVPSISVEPSAIPSQNPTMSPTVAVTVKSSARPSTSSSVAPSGTTAPSEGAEMSIGATFSQFWVGFVMGDQFAEYIVKIRGWITSLFLWYW